MSLKRDTKPKTTTPATTTPTTTTTTGPKNGGDGGFTGQTSLGGLSAKPGDHKRVVDVSQYGNGAMQDMLRERTSEPELAPAPRTATRTAPRGAGGPRGPRGPRNIR